MKYFIYALIVLFPFIAFAQTAEKEEYNKTLFWTLLAIHDAARITDAVQTWNASQEYGDYFHELNPINRYFLKGKKRYIAFHAGTLFATNYCAIKCRKHKITPVVLAITTGFYVGVVIRRF